MATDFHILAGFLGSGKTTLLLDFLATPEGADTAVLVNDVGAIDVDGAVVASSGDMPVAFLSNGCVCCSIGNDLVATVDDLVYGRIDAGLPPFRRMILECSGLSRPGPIIRSLADLGAHDFRVRVLSTFDAGQGAAHAANFEEAAAQLAAAQTVVLTKLDADGAPAPAAAAAAARAVSPLAQQQPRPQAVDPVEVQRGQATLGFALDPQVEIPGLGAGPDRGDQDRLPGAEPPGDAAQGEHQVPIHGQEGFAGTGLADGRAQAAGKCGQSRALRRERLAHAGFVPAAGQFKQAWMGDGQRPAHRRQQQRPVFVGQPAP